MEIRDVNQFSATSSIRHREIAPIAKASADNFSSAKRQEDNKAITGKEEVGLDRIVEDLNQVVEKVNKGLRFEYREDADRMYVEIVDVKTNDVLKELPPKEMLDLLAKIRDFVGTIIDEKI